MDMQTLFRLELAVLKDFMAEANGEIAAYNKLADMIPDSPFKRRVMVRAIFACIEAYIWHLKQLARAMHPAKPNVLTSEELYELDEIKPNRDKRGDFSPAKSSFKTRVKQAFHLYAKVLGHHYTLPLDDSSGRNFLASIEIRDRITHPKTAHDWQVSDHEVQQVTQAWIWFGERLVEITKLPVLPQA